MANYKIQVFHLFKFLFLLVQMQFAINHSTVYQNLLWLVS